jgi:hypothetical protein
MVLESDDCEDMVITALLHEAVEDRGGFPRVAEIRNCDRVANIKYPARQLCAAMISYLDSMAWQIKACKIAQDVPTPRSGRGRKAPATPAKLRWTPKRPRPEQRATHSPTPTLFGDTVRGGLLSGRRALHQHNHAGRQGAQEAVLKPCGPSRSQWKDTLPTYTI